MSQDFQDVTLNTEISQGLDLLQKRDLTAATRSDSQISFPTSPQDGHLFNHSGEKNVYAYVEGQWTKLWNYEFGAPYTINELRKEYQPLADNLTNFSAAGAAAKIVFAFPQQTYTIEPAWLREYGKCEDKTEFAEAEGIKNIAYLNGINGVADIVDGTIPASAFEKDLNTEVPREMSTGCVKRTFAPTWDTTKWLLMDGSTIGASVSNGKYRGDTYKKLFLSLGGTEGQWSSGQTVSLPDTTNSAIVQSGEKFETTSLTLWYGFKVEMEWRNGYANFETFTLVEDTNCDLIMQAGGGGGGSHSYGGDKNRGGSPGGSGSGMRATGTFKAGRYRLVLGKYGPGAGGSGAGSKGGYPGTSAEDTYLEYNETKIINLGGGKNGTGGVSTRHHPSTGVSGAGGIASRLVPNLPFPAENFTYFSNGKMNTQGVPTYSYLAGPTSPYQINYPSGKNCGEGGSGGNSGGGNGGNSYYSFTMNGKVSGLTVEIPAIYCYFLIRV